LRAYLAARTAIESLQVVACESFSQAAEDLAADRLSFAWLPAVTFARSAPAQRTRLLLQAIRGDQRSYFCAIFVRDDSPATTLADLKDKHIAWVNRDSSSGYVLAAHALVESGVHPGRESFTGSHAAVVKAVASREADAGSTFCSLDMQALPNRILSAGWTDTVEVAGVRFRPIETFGPVPGDVLCASPGTTYGERAAFASVMAKVHLDAEGLGLARGLFGADRFDIARPRDLQDLRAAAERLAHLDSA
jgi:phosphonate transport system substrate-binding protein